MKRSVFKAFPVLDVHLQPNRGKKLLTLVCGISMLLLAACSKSPSSVSLGGQGFQVRFDLLKGTFDVTMNDGRTILERAHAEVEVGKPGESANQVFRSTDGFQRKGSTRQGSDTLGSFTLAEIHLTGLSGAPDLTLKLTVYQNRPFFTVSLMARNSGTTEMVLSRLVPAKVEAGRGGALRLGTHPKEHRILESGSSFVLDFFVDLVPGDVKQPVESLVLQPFNGYQKGNSVSNWNHAIKDLPSGRAFVAGALDFEYSSPMFNTSFKEEEAVAVVGRRPFTYWSAEFPYLPAGKPLAAGVSHVAGPVLVIPDTARPLEALEAYAQAIKDWNNIRLWPERDPENRVPTGWNSWSGSGSSGGYGTNIDEQLMVDNLEVMAAEFKDFGGEWFQIDDGYEYHYGDWDWRTDRFPHGSAWMAGQIKAKGLLPGIWIAAMQADESSQTYLDHQADGWFPEQLPFVGGGKPALDPSHPEVLAWLTERFRKIRAEGYRWVKTDFSYWAMGAQAFHDKTATREEAYRRALAAIRAGLDKGALESGGKAGDTYWLSIAMMGPHMGYVDSMRPNLDTMPAWEKEQPNQTRVSAQGIKPTVRIIARRYYLQNRVWIFNHDLLFFRPHKDQTVPPLTTDESRCLVTAVGLSGSVAKLGERLVEMQPGWINDYRRMIPVFGRTARPLDLFEREYPEIWHLHVIPEEGLNTRGVGAAYDVVALFNWGVNFDLTANPYNEMADTARTLTLELKTIGLDNDTDYVAREFWTGAVLEQVKGTLTRSVAPHTVQLFALRKKAEHPQYIGGNRHLLQGAVEIRGLNWDRDQRLLSMTYDAAPGTAKAPFEHKLDFLLPAGWSLAGGTVTGAKAGTTRTELNGPVLTLSFSVETRLDAEIKLTFSAP